MTSRLLPAGALLALSFLVSGCYVPDNFTLVSHIEGTDQITETFEGDILEMMNDGSFGPVSDESFDGIIRSGTYDNMERLTADGPARIYYENEPRYSFGRAESDFIKYGPGEDLSEFGLEGPGYVVSIPPSTEQDYTELVGFVGKDLTGTVCFETEFELLYSSTDRLESSDGRHCLSGKLFELTGTILVFDLQA